MILDQFILSRTQYIENKRICPMTFFVRAIIEQRFDEIANEIYFDNFAYSIKACVCGYFNATCFVFDFHVVAQSEWEGHI